MDESILDSALSDVGEAACDVVGGGVVVVAAAATADEQVSNRDNPVLIGNINQNESLLIGDTEMSGEVTMTKYEGRPPCNVEGLKIKISTALGKSWVNNTDFTNKQNGEGVIRNGNDTDSQKTVGDIQIATTSNNCKEVENASDVNGHLDQVVNKCHQETTMDDSNSTAKNDMKLKLNCTVKGGKLLSHWEIMNKCLKKKTLFEALKISSVSPVVYKCTVCAFSKNMPQHVLFHMRSHRDLTSAFELYQNYEQLPTNIGEKQDEVTTPAPAPAPKVSRKRRKRKMLPQRNDDEEKAVFEVSNTDFDASKQIRSLSVASVTSDYLDTESNGEQSDLGKLVKKLKRRRKRRKKKKRKKYLVQSAALTSGGSTSSEDSDTNFKKLKSVTDFEASDSDRDIHKRLRKRKSLPVLCDDDFISDSYESHQPSDEIFDGMHHEDLSENVSADNPHYCQYCGMKFIRGNGIYRHYAKHEEETTSQSHKKKRKEKKNHVKNGTVSTTCQTTLSYKTNLLKSDHEIQDTKSLQQLESLVNKMLEYLVKDVEVLMELGWPSRNVSDLLIDILDRCELIPTNPPCEFGKAAILECIRQNAMKLLTFCVKDKVMERHGWKNQLVDDVIEDLIDKIENCSDETL